MSARLVAAVIAVTRGWLRVYICCMPSPLAEARRAEIESDIWEMPHDPDVPLGFRRGSIALVRLVDGIPDDISWRLENAETGEQLIWRRAFAFTAPILLVVTLLAMPAWFIKGRREIASCAAAVPTPNSTAAVRHEVIRCAGAFFSTSR